MLKFHFLWFKTIRQNQSQNWQNIPFLVSSTYDRYAQVCLALLFLQYSELIFNHTTKKNQRIVKT